MTTNRTTCLYKIDKTEPVVAAKCSIFCLMVHIQSISVFSWVDRKPLAITKMCHDDAVMWRLLYRDGTVSTMPVTISVLALKRASIHLNKKLSIVSCKPLSVMYKLSCIVRRIVQFFQHRANTIPCNWRSGIFLWSVYIQSYCCLYTCSTVLTYRCKTMIDFSSPFGKSDSLLIEKFLTCIKGNLTFHDVNIIFKILLWRKQGKSY